MNSTDKKTLIHEHNLITGQSQNRLPRTVNYYLRNYGFNEDETFKFLRDHRENRLTKQKIQVLEERTAKINELKKDINKKYFETKINEIANKNKITTLRLRNEQIRNKINDNLNKKQELINRENNIKTKLNNIITKSTLTQIKNKKNHFNNTIRTLNNKKQKQIYETIHNNTITEIKTDLENILMDKTKTININVKKLYGNGVNTHELLLLLKENVVSSDKLKISFDGKLTRPLNDMNLTKLINYANGVDNDGNYGTVSDNIYSGEVNNASSIMISGINSTATYSNAGGKFFNFINVSTFDLTLYGIYSNLTPEVIIKICRDNCLCIALNEGGLISDKLIQLRLLINCRNVSVKKLKIICEKLSIQINLTEKRVVNSSGNTVRKTQYGDSEEIYEIGLLEDHYFLNNLTNITSYAIKNYETIKDLNDFNRFRVKRGNGSYEKTKTLFLNAFDCVVMMKEYNFFKVMTKNQTNILSSIFYDLVSEDYDTLQVGNSVLRLADKKQRIEEEEKTKELNIREEKITELLGQLEEEYLKKDLVNTGELENYDMSNINRLSDLLEMERNSDGVYLMLEGLLGEKKQINYEIGAFDFETKTLQNGNIKSFVGCVVFENKFLKSGSISGDDYDTVGYRMLKQYIKSDTLLIAHNAKFDYGFIAPYLTEVQEIISDGRFICATGKFEKFYIKVIDFYNFVSEPLRNMEEIFGLTITKEFMPYELYNDYDIINNKFVTIDDVINNIRYCNNETDKKIFLENLEKWNLKSVNGLMFDALKYCVNYCVIDCDVLLKSYCIFRDWISKAVNIDIVTDMCLTASGIARKLLQNTECYKDCYAHNGAFLSYMSNFCVGGRVMCSNNKKQIVETVTDALDANSLYPSAIDELGGYLQGKPKPLTSKNYEDLINYDGYFIRVKILSVAKNLSMPLCSRFVDGIRIFTNNIINHIIFIDKISLEDLIEFQGVTFEIIDGFYYDEGRNENSVKLINHLYDTRRDCKKNDDKMEVVYKLIMNSAYGINLENPHDIEIKTFDDIKNFEVYLDRNYQAITEYLHYGNNKTRCFVKKEISDHFNTNHIGAEILAMSKRIMNRVLCLATENNINIYYQDTDSMFCDKDKINTICELYFIKYNKVLIGSSLGQFKPDLEIKYKNASGKKCNAENVGGINSIFLGKKCYYIKMEGETITGDKIVKDKTRMAGVTNSTILFYAKQNNTNILKMYEDLYDGKSLKFDLCEKNEETGERKFKVSYDKLLNKTLKQDFTRERKFV